MHSPTHNTHTHIHMHKHTIAIPQIKLPARAYCGEAVFVPRAQAAGEDDGYLVTFEHSYATGASSLVVYDAKTMSPAPVCRVAVPRRVPWGFHALWVPRSELDAQLPKGFVPAPLGVRDGESVGAGHGGEL